MITNKEYSELSKDLIEEIQYIGYKHIFDFNGSNITFESKALVFAPNELFFIDAKYLNKNNFTYDTSNLMN